MYQKQSDVSVYVSYIQMIIIIVSFEERLFYIIICFQYSNYKFSNIYVYWNEIKIREKLDWRVKTVNLLNAVILSAESLFSKFVGNIIFNYRAVSFDFDHIECNVFFFAECGYFGNANPVLMMCFMSDRRFIVFIDSID